MKWGPISVNWQAALAAFFVLNILPGALALQCYYCNGVTHYDPSDCFHPDPDKTIIQECRDDERCEKKTVQVDYWQVKVERGCSSNCGNRDYIWTEDFQVYCCYSEGLCNSASYIGHSWLRTLSLTLLISFILCCINKS